MPQRPGTIIRGIMRTVKANFPWKRFCKHRHQFRQSGSKLAEDHSFMGEPNNTKVFEATEGRIGDRLIRTIGQPSCARGLPLDNAVHQSAIETICQMCKYLQTSQYQTALRWGPGAACWCRQMADRMDGALDVLRRVFLTSEMQTWAALM